MFPAQSKAGAYIAGHKDRLLDAFGHTRIRQLGQIGSKVEELLVEPRVVGLVELRQGFEHQIPVDGGTAPIFRERVDRLMRVKMADGDGPLVKEALIVTSSGVQRYSCPAHMRVMTGLNPARASILRMLAPHQKDAWYPRR